LDQVPPQTLGKWLGVDAVVYGDVLHYEAYYAMLISAWQVGAEVKMVSTHDGEELFSADGSRYSVNFMPAFDPMDIAINSGLSLLELRDVTLARAEEEDAREIVLRIPRSEKLKSELIEEARRMDALEASASDIHSSTIRSDWKAARSQLGPGSRLLDFTTHKKRDAAEVRGFGARIGGDSTNEETD
jgi:hypothetical protein